MHAEKIRLSANLQSLHELLCSRLSDGTKIVDQVGLGHANSSVGQCEGVIILIGCDSDLKLLLTVQD